MTNQLLKRINKVTTPHAIVRKYLGYKVSKIKFDKAFNRFLYIVTGRKKQLTLDDVKWLKEVFGVGGLWDDSDVEVIENRTYKLK